jgi:hemoglobin
MKQLAAIAVVLAACGGSSPKQTTTTGDAPKKAAKLKVKKGDKAPDAKPGSLYARLGGQDAIVAVVDDFIGRVAADERINQRFFNVDIVKLKALLVEFVAQATGGPVQYSGQDMETSHAGMEVVDEEFTALVEDLIATLDKFKVPKKEKDELIGALGPLKPAIVTPSDRLKPVTGAELEKAKGVAKVITDKGTAAIYAAAIKALERGQRNYADQLFSRVEFATGAKAVAVAASVFRSGAPPRIATPTTKMPMDTPPQPKYVGSSDQDDPKAAPGKSILNGTMTIEGKPFSGLGTVMLWPAKGGKKRTPKTRIVEQRNKTFAPHVLAVPVGSTVQFPNFDGIYHNVFSISSPKKFDMGLYKDGETREVKFEKPGVVRLGCNIHAKMASFIIVVDAPHYVVVDGDKPFSFKTLSPGKYKYRAWSEQSAAPAEGEIVIKAGENTQTFDVKGGAEAGPSEDKFGMTRQPAAAPPKR